MLKESYEKISGEEMIRHPRIPQENHQLEKVKVVLLGTVHPRGETLASIDLGISMIKSSIDSGFVR